MILDARPLAHRLARSPGRPRSGWTRPGLIRRELSAMEAVLTAETPRLAAMFEVFNAPTAVPGGYGPAGYASTARASARGRACP